MKRSLLLGGICLCGALSFAQEDPVLMRINGKEILRSEFEYAYRRHIEISEVKPSPMEYTKSFILYKLKVDAAKTIGLDTTLNFRDRRKEYLEYLRKSYLIDTLAMDSCSRVLYQKMQLTHGKGQVQVMQLFKYLPQTVSVKHLQEEQNRMDSLYRVIVEKPEIDFAALVEKYSDDKRCRWVESLQTTSEFEEIAFSLPKGGVSKPFFTPEGLHILKVVDQKELPAYESLSGKLSEQLNDLQILNRGTRAVVERLKKDYHYTSNQQGIEELLKNGVTTLELFTIDGQKYTDAMFKRFASSYPLSVKRQLNSFIAKSLLDFESEKLESKHPEVHSAMQEYEENYLVTEVKRQQVDLPSMNDRAGLATYFNFHQANYRWVSPKFKGIVLHCADKKIAKQAKKLLKKVPEKEWADTLRKTFNTSIAEKIKFEQGNFGDGDNKYVDKLVFKRSGFESDMYYPFTIVVGEKKKGPDDYREVLEQVRKDYKNYLDTHWERELQVSGKVEINQEVLKTVNNN
ncbi:peptidylprolyl isomerase [Bacteroides sp.]|uniref:peptidylprolyl isomerase n=1 Tax=Bacteroides sp. TaxID=29523 RepID=UPI0026251C3D|nr:peptidylprolyl isomerase [Bacteroides sp.]MDD3039447.1 peptidylprolyl isomerase [Bacteroides sp.]